MLRYTVKETTDGRQWSIRDFNTLNKQSDYVQDKLFGSAVLYEKSRTILSHVELSST